MHGLLGSLVQGYINGSSFVLSLLTIWCHRNLDRMLYDLTSVNQAMVDTPRLVLTQFLLPSTDPMKMRSPFQTLAGQ